METGYVFLKLTPGKKKDSLKRIRNVEGVEEAQLVIGLFDAIVRIEGPTIEDLERLYLDRLDTIPGITDSRLQIVACARSQK
jgi:DNA-binding Lrp family transcriptional regulator